MKTPVGMQIQLHTFLTLALNGGDCHLHTLGKRLWYPLDRRLGEPQSWSGSGGKEKKNPFTAPSVNEPTIQSIAN
jgi:hypothetical protein